MKVGILTMHRLHNYGSLQQAFSLKIIMDYYVIRALNCALINTPNY